MKDVWRNLLAGWMGRLGGRLPAKRRERRLQLCETLSFGDRRFVALITVEGQKFLVGGAGHSLSLLASLPPAPAKAAPESARGIKIFK